MCWYHAVMRYRLLAIDLDGTLLCPEGRVSEENRAAICRAKAAGLTVVPCTGRGWREASYILEQIPDIDLGVFVTGAMIAEASTGRTLHHTPIETDVVVRLVDFLQEEPYAVLVYREPGHAGYEYLITGQGEVTSNSRWWFDFTGSKLHEQRQPVPEDLTHALRVGMVAPGSQMPRILDRVCDHFTGLVEAHAFAAVQAPDPDESVHILEVFAPGVDKWHGLSWIAQRLNIPTEQVAVIGDEINDVAMLRAAGCAIAMGNAVDAAKQHASYVTRPNHEHGVAHAIDQILAGQW